MDRVDHRSTCLFTHSFSKVSDAITGVSYVAPVGSETRASGLLVIMRSCKPFAACFFAQVVALLLLSAQAANLATCSVDQFFLMPSFMAETAHRSHDNQLPTAFQHTLSQLCTFTCAGTGEDANLNIAKSLRRHNYTT